MQTGKKDFVEARRQFLARCGRYSVATPPIMALMLATAERSYAKVVSGARHGNNGFGNGGGDPAPGNSANNPAPNAPQKGADRVR